MHFCLIDSVIQVEPGRIVALKNVSMAEEYLGDHFPGFPVLPGVFMLETLVQAGRALLAIAQFEADAARFGQLRYSLWTGDPGFAVYLWDCVQAQARFPTLDVFHAAPQLQAK